MIASILKRIVAYLLGCKKDSHQRLTSPPSYNVWVVVEQEKFPRTQAIHPNHLGRATN